MKKITLTLLLSFIYLYSVQAQDIYTTDGTLTGNRTVTMDAYNLNFSSTTGNLIYNGLGFVGIGTTAPASNLTISGSGPNPLSILAPTPNSVAEVDNNYDRFSVGGVLFTVPYVANSLIVKRNSTVSGTMTTTTDLVVTSSGYVGIGTASPAALLDIESSSSPAFKLTDGTQHAGYVLQSDGSGYAKWVNPSTFGVGLWTLSGTNIYNNNSGNVGIGTTDFNFYTTNGGTADVSPSLYIAMHNGGNAGLLLKGGISTSTIDWPTMGFALTNSGSKAILGASIWGVIVNNAYGSEEMDMAFTTKPASGPVAERMRITNTGKVLIGTVPSITTGSSLDDNYMLYVQKGIITEKVKVALTAGGSWSDYVFDKNYKLPDLNEVEDYIAANHHLPDVPSAADVSCDGIDLGDMDATLLRKIEELTLYVLELKKENQEIKAQIAKKQ